MSVLSSALRERAERREVLFVGAAARSVPSFYTSLLCFFFFGLLDFVLESCVVGFRLGCADKAVLLFILFSVFLALGWGESDRVG